MSYVGRAWMVAMAQGLLLGGGGGGGRASPEPSDPPSARLRQAVGRLPTTGPGDERRRQAEDAVQRAMFVSCWAPS